MLCFRITLTCLCLISISDYLVADNADTTQLYFNTDKTFKIVQFTDIHWESGLKGNALTALTMEEILDNEKPDLVVLTGDIVTSGDPVRGWYEVASPMINRKIKWVVTLGNHDSEGDVPRKEIYDIIKKIPYYTGGSEPTVSGVGNFSIPVHSLDNSTAAVIYLFDSHAYTPPYMPGYYDWIKTDQIEWYKKKSSAFSKANHNYPMPSFAFFHIPLVEYKLLVDDKSTIGHIAEQVSSPEINSGLFAAFVEKRDVIGVFAGHDHNNDFIGIYNDISLAYGRCTGYYAYGDFRQGARVIELYEGEFHFRSWIATPTKKQFDFTYPAGQKYGDTVKLLPPVSVRKELKKGIHYSYYEGNIQSVWQIKNLTEIKSGTLENFNLETAQSKDHFAFHFSGYLKIPENNIYQFYVLSDDGAVLYIDDDIVVDNDGSHSSKLVKGVVGLAKGLHKIRLLYFEDYMGSNLEVGISSLKMREGILLDNMLFIEK